MPKPRTCTALLPKIDYKDIRRAWFVYAGQYYSVAGAPTSVFRDAVLERAPQWRYKDEYWSLLKQDELDLSSRWYLLCSLADSHRALVLYPSRMAAEQENVRTEVARRTYERLAKEEGA
jgi:hypothetical protein